MIINPETEAGETALYRLQTEDIIWLTVVRPDGSPIPAPVWFVWEGDDSVIIYSRPEAKRLDHLRNNPKVALHFNSDYRGSDVVIMRGEVEFDDTITPLAENQTYIEKYGYNIRTRLGRTIEAMSAYSAGYRVKITYLSA